MFRDLSGVRFYRFANSTWNYLGEVDIEAQLKFRSWHGNQKDVMPICIHWTVQLYDAHGLEIRKLKI